MLNISAKRSRVFYRIQSSSDLIERKDSKFWYFRSLSTAYSFYTHHAPIAILLFTTAHIIDPLDKSLSCGYDKGAKQTERRLYTSIFWSITNYNNLFDIESAYLEIIQKFPTEAKAYLAYVNYAIKLILKLHSLPATSNYCLQEKQYNVFMNRCKDYLSKAKEFADDNELESILQLESILSSKIESIANDKTITQKQEKNKKITKWCAIGTGIFMGILFVIYLIVNAMGV